MGLKMSLVMGLIWVKMYRGLAWSWNRDRICLEFSSYDLNEIKIKDKEMKYKTYRLLSSSYSRFSIDFGSTSYSVTNYFCYYKLKFFIGNWWIQNQY